MKWTVFDFEFTELVPPFGTDWPATLRITCGSVFSCGDTWPQVWYEKPAEGSDVPGDHMSEATLSAFVDTLDALFAAGHTIVTWGGAATDWRLLMRECPSRAGAIKALALASVDVPMASCMTIGMMMGLNAACKALGYALKDTEASAGTPALWAAKTPVARQQVLQHVSNDSYATMLVVKQAAHSGSLPWITRRGELRQWPAQFLTVRECLARELPATPFQLAPNQNAKLLARWLLL